MTEGLSAETRQRALRFLKANARGLGEIARRDQDVDALDAEVVKATNEAMVLRLKKPGGDIAIKAFDGGDRNAMDALRKETTCLRHYTSSGLTPDGLAYCKDGGYVASRWIEGDPLDQVITEKTALRWAENLGAWLGAFAAASPERSAEGDWADYLERYDVFTSSYLLTAGRRLIEGMPLRSACISKNDGALSNFLCAPGGKLIGVDFEGAEIKPIGWDMMLTARALARRFPDQTDALTEAIAEEFCLETGLDPWAYAALTKLFVACRFEKPGESRPFAAVARSRFNDRSDLPAPVIGNPLHRVAKLETPSGEEVAALRNHIRALDAAYRADPAAGAASIPDDTKTLSAPSSIANQAMCTACQGYCCWTGRSRHAFIELETIARIHAARPGITTEALETAYVEALPAQSIVGSCLYHGPEGCVLPRSARADLCNRWKCEKLSRFEEDVDAAGGAEGAVVVGGKDAQILKAVQIRDGGVVEIDVSLFERSQQA